MDVFRREGLDGHASQREREWECCCIVRGVSVVQLNVGLKRLGLNTDLVELIIRRLNKVQVYRMARAPRGL